MARNLRGTPLTGAVCGGDQEFVRIMDQLPDDIIVFSSDFPHFEGIHDPASYYREKLAGLAPEKRDRFYSGAIADVFARMGDPVF